MQSLLRCNLLQLASLLGTFVKGVEHIFWLKIVQDLLFRGIWPSL